MDCIPLCSQHPEPCLDTRAIADQSHTQLMSGGTCLKLTCVSKPMQEQRRLTHNNQSFGTFHFSPSRTTS